MKLQLVSKKKIMSLSKYSLKEFYALWHGV